VESSQQHGGAVAETMSAMQQRLEAMEGELQALVESLRTGANRLTADLSLLQGNLGELYETTGVPGRDAAPVAPPVSPPPEPDVPIAANTLERRFEEPEPEVEVVEAHAPAAVAATQPGAPAGGGAPRAASSSNTASAGAASAADSEGARLVALNMALNGQSREETDRYLAENFDLPDRAGLLDEVYATVEG
jgi:hypothetical protein